MKNKLVPLRARHVIGAQLLAGRRKDRSASEAGIFLMRLNVTEKSEEETRVKLHWSLLILGMTKVLWFIGHYNQQYTDKSTFYVIISLRPCCCGHVREALFCISS